MTFLITVATTNANKLTELAAMAAASGADIRFCLPKHSADIEETGATFEENAVLKASAVEPSTGSTLILGEDSGLVVDALAGTYGIDPFPGLYSNRWLTPARYAEITGEAAKGELTYSDKNHALKALLDACGKVDRRGRYVCAMALRNAATGGVITVSGTAELAIVTGEPRGSGGFGYDPIAIAVELDAARTMAELSPEEKNSISHRGRAFQNLLRQLADQS